MNAREFIFREGTLSDSELNMIAERVVGMLLQRVPALVQASEKDKGADIIKMQDVCRLLQISDTTARAWVRDGRLPCHRKGNRVYFFKSEVLASLEQPLKRA